MSEIIMGGTSYSRGGLVKSINRRCKSCGESNWFDFETSIQRSEAMAQATHCKSCGEPYAGKKITPKRGWIYESITGNHFDPITEGRKAEQWWDKEQAKAVEREYYEKQRAEESKPFNFFT